MMSFLSEIELEGDFIGYHHDIEPDIKKVDYISPGGSMIATRRVLASS